MIKQRLKNLRDLLIKQNFAGYLIATTDEYLSEYAPEHAKRLEYITGFSGSNGLALILKHKVLFFTDGRYLNQCSLELDSELFSIFDLQQLDNFNWPSYITSDEVIAYDPKLFTERRLKAFAKIKLEPSEENLIDAIWSNQPAKPSSKIYDYPVKYAGEDAQVKIGKCRQFLTKEQADNLLITDSSSICWLLNLRAHDIEFSPLLLANAIVTMKQVYLFIDEVQKREIDLKKDGLEILDQANFARVIAELDGVTIFDSSQCSKYISDLITQKPHKNLKNPCTLWKACKNDVEIKYMQEGHVQDAVAVCEMLSFIAGQDLSTFSEYDLGLKLTDFRKKGASYVFDSFPTICGFKENGAVIHYRAEKNSAKKITGEGLLLIDSGGQYWGATTDITRTISIGKPSKEHRSFYTKVLKGHIALGSAIFPSNKISGAHLDALARQYLWAKGKDYAHGTGHGVGSFLSVHEGPQSISLTGFGTYLQKGMVVSNEPGYYENGAFGIRIENMMYVANSAPGFLCFKNLTLVPYARDLIDIDMLNQSELEYLQKSYNEIKEKVAPLLSDSAKKWLLAEIEI
jgi:Xaa-Pro aminopeptidase